MKSIHFCYWLQGYFEVLAAGSDAAAELTSEQVACIKDHLALVLTKVTPERSADERRKKATKGKKVKQVVVLDPFKVEMDPFTLPDVMCTSLEEKPIDWVAPPVNPNQVRLDIEAEFKKTLDKRKREPYAEPFRTSCAWHGVGHGRKIC